MQTTRGLQASRSLRSTHHHHSNLRPVQTRAGFLDALFGNKVKQLEEKKAELLELIAPLKRGVDADEAQQDEVDAAASALERLNPTRNPLSSPLINGKWELLYTTSASILGSSRPSLLRPSGPIYQTIDVEELKALNSETTPFFNSVSAELTPVSKSLVAVQFKQFGLFGGLIKITAPESAKGSLDTTYLDEELRISRGDKGNLFILRMADEDARLST